MKFTILSATMDLFKNWNVKISLNDKTYSYRLSEPDYQRMEKEYRRENYKVAINILKGG